jgi:sulfite dehydrogenase (cytochrome) subunit B
MMRALLVTTAILLSAAATGLAQERPVTLKESSGRTVTENICSGCHSLDYIRINAPFMNRQTWTASVNKMVQMFGAPIAPADAAVIIDYLTSNYGSPAGSEK